MNIIPDSFVISLISDDMIMKRSLPYWFIWHRLMDQSGNFRFICTNNPAQGRIGRCFYVTSDYYNHMDMIGHNNILINFNAGIMHWNCIYGSSRYFPIAAEILNCSEQTLFFVGANRNKVIIILRIIVVWNSGRFSNRFIHNSPLYLTASGCCDALHRREGQAPPLRFAYFSFFHSLTAISSQRLFLGLVAWPLTQ